MKNIKALKFVPKVVKNLLKQTDIVGYVERMDSYFIYGWVISEKGLRPRLKCTIGNKEQPIYTKWVERTDVAEQYGSKYSHSGFQISLVENEQTLDEFIASDKPIKIFANDVLLPNIADEQEQMSAAVSRLLSTEKTEKSARKDLQLKVSALALKEESLTSIYNYKGDDFSATLESWGHFVLKGTTDLKDNAVIQLLCNDKALECPVLWKEITRELIEKDSEEIIEQELKEFQIEIPGYIWEDSIDGVCELEIYLNEENITETPLKLATAKVLNWISDIIKIPESQDKQYRLLLALEHIHYGNLLNTLSEKELIAIRIFAEKMQLTDFIFTEDNKAIVIKPVTESVVILSQWKALSLLNSKLTGKESSIFEQVKSVIKELKLKGRVREKFLISLAPKLCNTEEFLRLREYLDFDELKKASISSNQLWEMAIGLPAIIFDQELETATNVAYKMAKELLESKSWLSTESIRYAVELSRQIESEGEIEISKVEQFRYAVIAVLDGFKSEWFSRLHDQNLINSMVLILSDLYRYTDYHRRDVISAALRIYGLNPAFWETAIEQNVLELDHELMNGYQYFKKIHMALVTIDSNSIVNLLETIAEPLAYFRAKNNPEAVIFLREILFNHLNELNGSLPSRGKALLAKLLNSTPSEALRLAAFPIAKENQLITVFPETAPSIIRETLRLLNASDKSFVLQLQEQASIELNKLLTAHQEKNLHAIEKVLVSLERDAMSLNNWQGSFLAFDLLASAYIIADTNNFDGSALFARMLFILEKVSKETKPDWYLSAPVLAGLIRLSNYFNSKNNTLLNSFLSECRSIISLKFGERMDDLFLPVAAPQLPVSLAGWPQDTLVVVYSCKKYLDTRVKMIRETWIQDLKARNIPYIILVGDGDDSITDDVLALDVSDRYEDLPAKTLKLFEWIYHNSNAQYVLKIDDDCYLDVEHFFNTLSYRKHFYYGRVIKRAVGSMDRAWHQAKSDTIRAKKSIDKSPEPSVYADGGGAYVLSRLGMLKLLEAKKSIEGERLIACSFMEDKLVGDLLALSFIEPSNEDYDSYQRRRTFAGAMPVGMWENTFFPCQATPTKVTHLDTEKDLVATRAKATSKELWPKKLWPTYQPPSIILNPATKSYHNQLELLTDKATATELLVNELVVICVVYNEMIMLPHFLSHYRGLGVKNFIFVDNCSDDGSREYLYQQPDVILYSADTDYKYSHYGVAWQQTILGNLCLGKWVLIADADELFVYPDCENRSLADFITVLEEEESNAACVYMVDMYPEGDLSEADFTKYSPFEIANYFDAPTIAPWYLGSGAFSNSLSTVSCLRHRMVPNSVPYEFVSQKFALFRYFPWLRFSQGLHYASNLKVSNQHAWFAHFKYHAGFKEKVETEIHRGQHFNNAAEYRRYLTMLNESKGGFRQENISVKYMNSNDFAKTTTDIIANQ